MFRADVDDGSGNLQTIMNYSSITYEIPLNGVRVFTVLIDGSGDDFLTAFANERTIYFYFNESLELKGKIRRVSPASTGALQLEGIGLIEHLLNQANCPANTWTSRNTTQVMSSDGTNLLDMTGSPRQVAAGTIANQTAASFRTASNESVLNGVTRFTKLTAQDASFVDSSMALGISDHLGSSTSIGTWTDGIEICNVIQEQDATEKIKKVTVIGKGFGANQVSGSYGPAWAQGDAEVTETNKACETSTECTALATKIYNIKNLTRYAYTFEVLSPYLSFSLGDVVTIQSSKIGANGVDLRITKMKRVLTKTVQKLYLEVRGTTERETKEDTYKKEQAVKAALEDSQSLSQPTGNGTANIGMSGAVTDSNCNSSKSGSVTAANCNSSKAGSVSAANCNSSKSGAVSVAGTTGNGYYYGNYSTTPTGDNSWRDVGQSITVGSDAFSWHLIHVAIRIELDDGGGGHSVGCNVYLRAKNTTDTAYWPDTNGIKLTGSFNVKGVGTYIMSGVIMIPKSWASKTYNLQYLIQNETYWVVSGQEIVYSYMGEIGHPHGDTIAVSNGSQTHSDTISVSNGSQSHADTIAVSNGSQHHDNTLTGTDSGHFNE